MRTHSRAGWTALVTLTVGALILASCSTTQTSPSTATEGKPHGSLTIVAKFGLDGLDPPMMQSSTFTARGYPIFDSLVDLGPDRQPAPGIAERWEIAKDGLTHTFFIREGVKFHNGDELTGADVKFSVERFLSEPASINTSVAVWRSQVASVELKDEYTVALHLKQPQFDLLIGLSSLSGIGAVMPKKYIEEKGLDYFTRNPVGSGPFKFVSFTPGERIQLEAVESHWQAVPKFKNVSIIAVTEAATAVAMLKTGELDIADVNVESVAGLKSAGLGIFTVPEQGGYFLVVFHDVNNPDKWALSDVRARKALSLAINRQELADKMFGGYAQPGVVNATGPSAFFWDPGVLKPDPYDPQQAKKLLADAGYPNGFSTKIWDTGRQVGVNELNQATAGYWRAVGINAELVRKEYATLRTLWVPKQVPEVWGTVWGEGGGGGTNFEGMRIIYHSQGSVYKNVPNSRLDELIDKVPLAVDMAEKKRLALEATLLAKNLYGVIQVLLSDKILAFSPKLGAMTPGQAYGSLIRYELLTHPK